MTSNCCDATITYNSDENIYQCSECLRQVMSEEMYPCDDDSQLDVNLPFDNEDDEGFTEPEDEYYNDLGGTGHGDISFSDADPGL